MDGCIGKAANAKPAYAASFAAHDAIVHHDHVKSNLEPVAVREYE